MSGNMKLIHLNCEWHRQADELLLHAAEVQA